MGSTVFDDEQPVHDVRISRPFYLGKYPVTQAQWEAVMGTNTSYFQGHPRRPVENVSWEEAQAFIERLNDVEGHRQYRLPTEAQWEYAARAGSTTDYYFGDDVNRLHHYAWWASNSGGRLILSGSASQTPGDDTTCTVTCGNGSRIGTTTRTMRRVANRIPKGPQHLYTGS